VNETVVDIYKQKRIRSGKTARDRADGAFKRNADNKAIRAAWQKDSNKNAAFPAHTCNGQATRALRPKQQKKK
jgi:hypothetical protein